ncbi:uncharacterized protein snsl [Drosophila virilis]|uniref:Uncharacterized protein, isoform A n=1 Tax=Drosophila virilis TaxID=7244 RepID=B4MDJ5_DROVI|nr:uncharacterized protein LOC6635663 [Drosophila virilis]XP_032294711.1 uncharacterized protein LOC6635663 [Drosophila virilis]EDW71256.1 uncharacterized protein Dvir_GJ16263, isoform A [Drosophila virilis]KRF85589.1 uncharacterized protein Dvir_GJ16263, isoform B [Drosophila virilis]
MFWPKQLPLTVSLWLLLCLLQSENVNGFIVPQELQSALSLVYSNIPPIKKGTDSRLGFGFRLGEHADFQVLLELGPQKNTRPLGEPSKDDQSFNKRQVSASEQREQLRQQQLLTSTERTAASWLETWSKGMKPQPAKAKLKPGNKQTAKLALPTRPALATDAVQQLQLLYKMATKETPSTSTEQPPAAETPNLDPPRGFKLPPPALAQDTNSLGNSKPTKSRAEITKELMNVSLEA